MRCDYRKFTESLQGKYVNGFYFNSKWYSIKWINGEPYKQRVETLVFNNNMSTVFMSLNEGNQYKLPGGHIELKVSKLQQAIDECREEARLIVKNMKYAGSYMEIHNSYKPNVEDRIPLSFKGQIVDMFIGRFDGFYNKNVFSHLSDENIYFNGKFHPISEIYGILKKHHKDLLDTMLVGY